MSNLVESNLQTSDPVGADVAIFNQEQAPALACQPPHHKVGLHPHNNQGAS